MYYIPKITPMVITSVIKSKLLTLSTHYSVTANSCCGLCEPFLSLERPDPLILKSLVVLEQGHQRLGLFADVDALVFVVVQVLEVLQSLDGEDVFFALLGNLWKQSRIVLFITRD